MAYIKPQVLVSQEFSAQTTDLSATLRAWIVGPNAILHRYAEADEKVGIELGDYATYLSTGGSFTYPGILPGSVVDESYVKLFVDDAMLEYLAPFDDELVKTGDKYDLADNADKHFVYALASEDNRIVFNNFNVMENGQQHRDPSLGLRDVKIGDYVILSYYVQDTSANLCAKKELTTRVIDYVVNRGNGVIEDAVRTTNVYKVAVNATTSISDYKVIVTDTISEDVVGTTYVLTFNVVTEDETTTTTCTIDSGDPITLTAENGYFNINVVPGLAVQVTDAVTDGATISLECVESDGTDGGAPIYNNKSPYTTALPIAISGTYDGLPTGYIEQAYVIQVTAINKTTGCVNCELRITSESGMDNRDYVQAVEDASGNFVFDIIGEGANAVKGTIYGAGNEVAGFASISDLEVGSSWEYTFRGAYSPLELTASAVNADTGYTGLYDDTYIVTCVQGGSVTGTDKPVVNIKTALGYDYINNITVTAGKEIVTSQGVKLTFGTSGDLAYGDVFEIPVEAGANGAVQSVALRDSLPSQFLSASIHDLRILDCSLQYKTDIEVPQTSQVTAAKNFTFDTLNQEVEIASNIKVYNDEFLTNDGYKPLNLMAGTMYLQYREWVQSAVNELGIISTTGDLQTIPGQLSPDNPLKYAVYKALANSNGTEVAYTAVAGTQTLDDWSAAFNTASGSTKVYSIVPLTRDLAIQNLAFAMSKEDSSDETDAWKHCIFNTMAPVEQMVVGENKDSNNLRTTSTDGKIVRATITKPTGSNRYIKVTVPQDYPGYEANSEFLTTVKPGDELRIGFDDAEGTYLHYTVDSVESNTTLTLVNGPQLGTFAVTPQRIEVWHKLTKQEQVDYVIDVAGSFSNRRVELVWPDIVGENGVELPGYFLCAAIGGMMSGVQSHQGLTRVEIAGFDDYSRTRPYFSESQIKSLASNGVWVCMEDNTGTPYTMHAVTTDPTDINTREEMVTRNVDWLSFYFYGALDPYIGTTNVTQDTIASIKSTITYYADSLMASATTGIGSAILSYSIENIEQDVLLKDHINVTVGITIPYSVNNIYLRLHI